MKKTYTKPELLIVKVQQTQLLCESPAAAGLANPYYMNWNRGGWNYGEYDY